MTRLCHGEATSGKRAQLFPGPMLDLAWRFATVAQVSSSNQIEHAPEMDHGEAGNNVIGVEVFSKLMRREWVKNMRCR